MVATTTRPKASSVADQHRQDLADKKLLILEGDWTGLVDTALQAFFDQSVIGRIESARDTSRNPAKYAWKAVNTVHEIVPTTTIPDGKDPSEIVTEALWALRHQAQLYTNALGDCFFRVDWRDGVVCYRVVAPNVVEVEADSQDPTKIAWIRETMLRWSGGSWVWTRDTFDLRGEKPIYRVDQWSDGDTAKQIAPGWSEVTQLYASELRDGYPYWSHDKPVMPYIGCHSRIGGTMYQEHGWLEVLAATIAAACLHTFWLAGFRDCAFGKYYTLDATIPSAANLREGEAPDRVLWEVGSILNLVSKNPDRPGSLNSVPGTMNIAEALGAIDSYVANALRDAGLGPVDEAPAKGVSGAAITISREALRRSQRQQVPAARKADREILATAAKLANAYSTKPGRVILPEDPNEWQIRYNGIPPSVEEVNAAVTKATQLRGAGLATRWMGVQMAFPELTEQQAKDLADEIRREEAEERAAANPQPQTEANADGPATAAQPTLVLTPSDAATIATVDEGRAANGLPPWPNAEEGKMTIAAFQAKYAATIAEAANAATGDASPVSKPQPEPQQAPGEANADG